MALRGSMTYINVYSDLALPAIGFYQNHFNPSYYDSIANETYVYKTFTRSDIIDDVTSTNSELRLDFFATTEDITFVEDAINNNYVFVVWSAIWDSTQGIDNPTTTTIASAFIGSAVKGDITHTTASLTLGSREDTLNGDFPSKKIPYAVLGPLNLGR